MILSRIKCEIQWLPYIPFIKKLTTPKAKVYNQAPSDIYLHNRKYTFSCLTLTFPNRLRKALAWDFLTDEQNFKIRSPFPWTICLNHHKIDIALVPCTFPKNIEQKLTWYFLTDK